MPAKDKLQFEESTHRYTYDGKRIPSVTQVIRAVLPGGFQAEDWYLQRGRAVHACAAFIAQGLTFEHDPQINGQVAAIRRFFREVKPEVISFENKMGSSLYRFAGTPDLICRIEGKKVIVDYKASLDLERTSLQLGGYSVLVEETQKMTIHNGRGVVIKADGKYQMSELINLRKARREFLNLRSTYAIMERLNILPREEK